MKYLLDTCFLSELIKRRPNPNVLRWLDKQDEDQLYLSVLTIGELQKGIGKLPDIARQEELQAWVDNDLAIRFEGRILPIDTEVASQWGILLGKTEKAGKKLPVIDSLIAATATVHNLTVVTRNTKDLEKCQAQAFNPWED